MQHLDKLNDKQMKAVLHKDGPLLILAGAGAGKTKTLTHRIANLVHEGVLPHQILAVTFTNKAAKEMRDRVSDLLEHDSLVGRGLPFVSTFHSLGVNIIKENPSVFNTKKHFSILDQKDALKLVKASLVELGFDPKEFEPKKAMGIISKQKSLGKTVLDLKGNTQSAVEDMIVEVWTKYEAKKKKEDAFDFDDLLLLPMKALEDNKTLRDYYQDKWKYIHIDEYQDTNEVQYRIVLTLTGSDKNLCVVGDGDQNIYSWRGANLRNILNFEHDFPGASTIVLEQNYRSTKTILSAANTIIDKNTKRKKKTLFTENTQGDKIHHYTARNEWDEASFVSKTIQKQIEQGTNPKDFAILYRANFQSRVLEEAMLGSNIPYTVLGVKFFDRKEVKDVLSYIKAALNPDSLSDISRIINFPKRGLGKVTIAKLFAGEGNSLPEKTQVKIRSFYNALESIKEAVEEKLPSEAILFAIQKSGIEESYKLGGTEDDFERLENIKEMLTFAKKYDEVEDGMSLLLEDAALASDQDTLTLEEKQSKNAVKMMTVHASKGLEFPNVFIVGLEQDLFPHKRDHNQTLEEAEEERRLFYVALTRGEKKIYLTGATMRTIFGETKLQYPSEFIADIPEELLDITEYEEKHERSSSYKKGSNDDSFFDSVVYVD
ncbi:MAG: DNA helicase-2/ATP-dependent DNA helicase PcrA [Candidatus Paceibacteria bacterium]|jgi:DNA helicase-2/ATP-dependent DNA helicase PcrA